MYKYLTEDQFISDYNEIKKSAHIYFENNEFEKCVEAIGFAAKIAYKFNFFYADDELEELITKLSLKIKSTKDFQPVKNKWVFYECFGWDNRGLTQQYLRALISWNVEVLLILENELKPELSKDIIDEIKLYDNIEVYVIDKNLSFIEKSHAVNLKISHFQPKSAFLHLAPWSVLACTIWTELQNVERYMINLTDHAFWLGKNSFDYCIEFRDYGYNISNKHRNIAQNKLVVQPYYPIIRDNNTFEGFPIDISGKKIIVTGGGYYKYFGEKDKFFKLLQSIISKHKDVIIFIAGSGDLTLMNALLKKYNLKQNTYLLGDRKDIVEVIKKATIYIASYPLSGGLISQIALQNNIPTLSFCKEYLYLNHLESLILPDKKLKLSYFDEESFLQEVSKILNNDHYRTSKINLAKDSIISVEAFNQSLKNFIENKSHSISKNIEIDVSHVSKLYLEAENKVVKDYHAILASNSHLINNVFYRKNILALNKNNTKAMQPSLFKLKENFKNSIIKYFSILHKVVLKNIGKQDKIHTINLFKQVGLNFNLGENATIKNGKYITIGNDFSASERFRIEAWDFYGEQKFSPEIIIGNNVSFNTDIHIGCINKIKIGNNCLFASRIYITDHHHGETTIEMMEIIPKDRPLISKGPVIIEDNVWIGEGVAIMPNVRIGKNSIIATNAVVTKDVPPNSVAAGIPARVIKNIL